MLCVCRGGGWGVWVGESLGGDGRAFRLHLHSRFAFFLSLCVVQLRKDHNYLWNDLDCTVVQRAIFEREGPFRCNFNRSDVSLRAFVRSCACGARARVLCVCARMCDRDDVCICVWSWLLGFCILDPVDPNNPDPDEDGITCGLFFLVLLCYCRLNHVL